VYQSIGVRPHTEKRNDPIAKPNQPFCKVAESAKRSLHKINDPIREIIQVSEIATSRLPANRNFEENKKHQMLCRMGETGGFP
jgi:hypothetical protein